jgi:hypothetical protein
MQMQEIKDSLKKIVTNLNYEKNFESCLIMLIDEYRGETPEKFFEAFFKLVLLLADHKELSVKAAAYDKIVAIEKEYRESIEELKKEYEHAQNTEQMETPPVFISASE